MSKDEALELLKMHLKEHQMDDMVRTAELLEFLAYLPLTLRQASAFMAKKHISTSEYLEICRSSSKDMIDLLSRDFEDRHRYKESQNPVVVTWLISFHDIADHDQLAVDYLKFTCFMSEKSEKDIPRSLLPPAGKLAATEAIGTLKTYALITEREESDLYDIHRLVQLAMLNWLAEKGGLKEWTIKVLKQLADDFPFPEHESREIWMRYLPHTQYILELRKNSGDRRIELDLLSNVGVGFDILGRYEEAEAMHRWAVEGKEKALGPKHPSTLASINNLGAVLYRQGKYSEAEAMHRWALESKVKMLGPKHPSTLITIKTLGAALLRQGKYEEADVMHQQAVTGRETVLGPEHPETLTSIIDLYVTLCTQGKYDEAKALLISPCARER